ncbi:MAG: hypothetical protein D8B49_06955 [Riemerella sp.]|nr:MAG: hypothetical protein D8B49_06955 [Riemerella sp.]
MKKLFLTGALALFGLMNAQKTESGIRLGVNAGIPVGDFGKFTTFTAGVDLAYLYPLAENFRLGVATGYSHYFGKKTKTDLILVTLKNEVPDVGIIPVAATAEFTFGDSNVFLGADLGYAFFTKKDFKNENGSFYYQPKLGYSFDKRHDLYFSYKGFTRNNANAGSINLGYAYNF